MTFPDHLKQTVLNDVRNALAEDIGKLDLTAQLVPAEQQAHARVITRQPAVICGQAWFAASFRELEPNCEIDWLVAEGASVQAGQTLCEIHGHSRTLLTAERTALNFLQLLSAVASKTRVYVDVIQGTTAKILDTRKTLPGLRLAQKYAVTVGGGYNQRIALYDGVLIKENHIAAAGSIEAVMQQALAITPAGTSIQIEVENLTQLEQALSAGAKLILLDNFSTEQMRQAVSLTQKRAELEASGGITLDNLRDIAETGVDRISIGSLTKDIQAVDLSMRIVKQT